MKKRILSIVLAICLVLTLVPTTVFADGDTPQTDTDGVYQIGTTAELYGFAQLVNTGNTDKNTKAVLTADIVVNKDVLKADGTLNTGTFTDWTPIGYWNSTTGHVCYSGTFDGQGHTISGLYFNDANTDYVGLFGDLQSGEIKNVGVVDSYFKGGVNVGGVCAWNFGGKITGCYNTGTVSGNYVVGGVCGYNAEGSKITACYNTGTVSGNERVGGVCGFIRDAIITGCYTNNGGVYGAGDATVTDCAEHKGDEFKDGTVCGLLNTALQNASADVRFCQRIGTDASPLLTYQFESIDEHTYGVYTVDNNTFKATCLCGKKDTKTMELTLTTENNVVAKGEENTITATLSNYDNETVTYKWYQNDALIDNATSSTYKMPTNLPFGTYTYEVQVTMAGAGTIKNSVDIFVDNDPPTGEISIGTKSWKTYLSNITFDIFFKDTQTVAITAADNSGETVKIEYLLSDRELDETELAGATFTEYNDSFSIIPNNEYVIYARLTDKSDNVRYINSNGVVLDATAPVITGVTDGAVYYTTQKAVVADENLESVTLNGVSIEGTTVTLDGDKDAVYTIVATDKSENSTTVTVTMKSISSLAESIEDVNDENVKSSDTDKIEAVKESVGEIDTSNATDSEKEALNDIDERCNELLDIIDKAQKAKETENIKNAEEISLDNVTEDDREALDKAKADFEKALEDYGSNYTDDETTNIELDLERIDESLKVLDNVKAVEDLITAIPDTFKPDDLDTVQKIQNAKKSYDALTDYEKSLISKDIKAKLDTLLAGISDYIVYEGDGGVWTIGQDGGLTFTANGAYSKFTGIKVDGEDVDRSNYTAKSGSTIITLNADYLNTLSVGTHTLTVLYTDGEANTEFEVKKAPEETTITEGTTITEETTNTEETEETAKPNNNTSKKSPQTGNDINSTLWLALLLSCGGAVIVTGAYSKRKKHSAK